MIEFSLCPVGRFRIPEYAHSLTEIERLRKRVDILCERDGVMWFKTKDYLEYRRLLKLYPHHRYSSVSLIYLERMSTLDNRFE